MMTTLTVNPLFIDFYDDAAVFPPGNLPVEQAVPAHRRHRQGAHAPMVGPLVLGAQHVETLAACGDDRAGTVVEVALSVPISQASGVLAIADRIAAITVTALELSLTVDARPEELLAQLAGMDLPSVPVFIEIPRDARHDDLLHVLGGTAYLAKFRTGGVRSDLYPDVDELAHSVHTAVREHVPFKATAGLHHAVRNTDLQTGFNQHGFLNLMNTTAAALDGAAEPELSELLSDRDAVRVSSRAAQQTADLRASLRSIGTCSIHDPVTELVDLELLEPTLRSDLP